ncbi:MAG TPA: CPBP family intramembrane glutamic endopeptidase [Candidatus Limnocylindrales bacterium]|nr:CPBP family intramembrane glutamic endopeptidase [Candidatus Limnocylindrales bacterium]
METTLRVLVGLGLTLLLVMLRVEANAFGAAEYDEPVDGRRRSIWRRLAWYALGIGGIAAITVVHPSADVDLFLTVGTKLAILLGLALGIGGVALAIGMAWLRYRRIRLPEAWSYPGALTNEILTAFIDEATFRGALFGYLLWIGTPLNLAIVAQALAYTLATRLGAPGRDVTMFLLSLVIGLVGGTVTFWTDGIGAAFLGHAVTRVAVFLTTGHAGQLAPKGTEPEEVERRRQAPIGWHSVERGTRDPALRESGADR